MTNTGLLRISDKDFETLRNIIYERSGIHFQDSKRYVLEGRLSRRIEELGLDDFGQYIDFLTMGPYQTEEFQEMFNRITINETSFFRNEAQLDVFESKVLAKLLDARADSKRLRVWSAACSSGEEPYSLAIMIHRTLGIRLTDWHIEILGTDISQKVLDLALAGVYSDFSFRSVDINIKKRYFTDTTEGQCLDPTIKSMVNFEQHNLRDTMRARRHGKWDAIFCRNVMIYFDEDMKRQCVQLFYDQLADDGVLFIGHSESIRNTGVPFVPLGDAKAFAYVKG